MKSTSTPFVPPPAELTTVVQFWFGLARARRRTPVELSTETQPALPTWLVKIPPVSSGTKLPSKQLISGSGGAEAVVPPLAAAVAGTARARTATRAERRERVMGVT